MSCHVEMFGMMQTSLVSSCTCTTWRAHQCQLLGKPAWLPSSKSLKSLQSTRVFFKPTKLRGGAAMSLGKTMQAQCLIGADFLAGAHGQIWLSQLRLENSRSHAWMKRWIRAKPLGQCACFSRIMCLEFFVANSEKWNRWLAACFLNSCMDVLMSWCWWHSCLAWMHFLHPGLRKITPEIALANLAFCTFAFCTFAPCTCMLYLLHSAWHVCAWYFFALCTLNFCTLHLVLFALHCLHFALLHFACMFCTCCFLHIAICTLHRLFAFLHLRLQFAHCSFAVCMSNAKCKVQKGISMQCAKKVPVQCAKSTMCKV